MELKKNVKSDLEKHKNTFLLTGYVLALAIVIVLFNWKSTSGGIEKIEVQSTEMEEEMVEITRMEEVKPPEPPPKPQITEIIEIVEDEAEIENEMEVLDMEATEEDEIIAEVEVEEEQEEQEEQIFMIAENPPQFPGGDLELRKFVAKNIKYPAIARENDITGTVYIRFVVTKTGVVDRVQLVRGVDPLLDKEAVRVVKTLPKWKPGKQRGVPVSVYYTMPIKFELQ